MRSRTDCRSCAATVRSNSTGAASSWAPMAPPSPSRWVPPCKNAPDVQTAGSHVRLRSIIAHGGHGMMPKAARWWAIKDRSPSQQSVERFARRQRHTKTRLYWPVACSISLLQGYRNGLLWGILSCTCTRRCDVPPKLHAWLQPRLRGESQPGLTVLVK